MRPADPMSIQILRIAALCYAGAAASYLLFFARPRHVRAAAVGQALLSVAFLVHAVAIGVGCSEFGGREFFSMRGGLAFIAFLAAGAYLLLQRFYRIPSVGAFVTPLIVVVLLPALFGTPGWDGSPNSIGTSTTSMSGVMNAPTVGMWYQRCSTR